MSTTPEILTELGARLAQLRLQQNVTVEALAAKAGVGERTLRRAESGTNTSLETLVRILRALGRLDALEEFFPQPLVSPIQLAKDQVRERKRAWAPRPTRRGE